MKVEIDVAPIFEDKLGVDTVTLLEHLAQAWQENTDEAAMISALETALCLARDLEGNAGETVRTSRRTHNINWKAPRTIAGFGDSALAERTSAGLVPR